MVSYQEDKSFVLLYLIVQQNWPSDPLSHQTLDSAVENQAIAMKTISKLRQGANIQIKLDSYQFTQDISEHC